jgi:hypothetical protein
MNMLQTTKYVIINGIKRMENFKISKIGDTWIKSDFRLKCRYFLKTGNHNKTGNEILCLEHYNNKAANKVCVDQPSLYIKTITYKTMVLDNLKIKKKRKNQFQIQINQCYGMK